MAHEQGAEPVIGRLRRAAAGARPEGRRRAEGALRTAAAHLRGLPQRLRAFFDPTRQRLGWLLACLNVGLVLLVVAAISGSATALLDDLAEENAFARVRLGGAVAREEVRREAEDAVSTARLLAGRPTLQRLLAEERPPALQPYLARFCEVRNGSACAVYQGAELLASAGAEVPWDALLAAAEEQGERFLVNVPPPGSPLAGGRARIEGAIDRSVIVVRPLDDTLSRALSAHTGLDVRVSGYSASDAAPEDEISQLHSTALSDGESAARLLEGQDVYAASFPLLASTGEAIAFIDARLPAADVASSVGRFTRRLTITALIVALIAGCAGVLLGEQVVRPLRALSASALRLGRGDLSTSIPSRGPAEVGALARTMEEMRRSLVELTGALRRREAEAQAVLSGIVEGVYAVDAQRRITYMNPQAERMLGRDALGRFCGDVLQPCGQNGVRPCETSCPIVAAREAGSAQATERLKLGGERPRTVVITSAQPVDGLQVQVLRDETELESVRSARDSVLANISHEFRTPLGAQLASIELLRDGIDTMSREEMRELVLALERGTQRLTRLIDNLLESVRIESGQLALRRQRLELAEVLEDAVTLIGSLLSQRGQKLEIDLPEDLPAFDGDGPRLAQVFVNLLANASKFAPDGSVVRVGAQADDGRIRAWVEDEGPGLPDMGGGTIFDRFHRGPDEEPEPGGLGLGLWIVKSIVERMGGVVAAERTAEERTRFTVSLPLRSVQ
jgi:signal transduction histidine kinase